MSIASQVIAHSSNLRWVISTLVTPKSRITGPSANQPRSAMSHISQPDRSLRPMSRTNLVR